MKAALVLFAAVSTLAFGSVSHASALHCEGNYMFHDFTIDGNVSGTRVPGQVRFVISSGGSVVKSGMMTVTSSSVQAGKSIQLTARSSDGSAGELSTAFEPDSGTYTGTLSAHAPQGNVDVSVECGLN